MPPLITFLALIYNDHIPVYPEICNTNLAFRRNRASFLNFGRGTKSLHTALVHTQIQLDGMSGDRQGLAGHDQSAAVLAPTHAQARGATIPRWCYPSRALGPLRAMVAQAYPARVILHSVRRPSVSCKRAARCRNARNLRIMVSWLVSAIQTLRRSCIRSSTKPQARTGTDQNG